MILLLFLHFGNIIYFKNNRFIMSLFKSYRTKDWEHFLGLTLLGYSLNKFSPPFYKPLIKLIISALLLSFAFSWNEFFDKKLSKRKIIFPLLPLFPIPFLIDFINSQTKILTFLFFLITSLYSFSPIRLKAYPFIGTFCNALGFSLLFLIGVNDYQNKFVWPIYFGLFSLLSVAQLIHELSHLLEDKSERILTTALFLGKKKTTFLIFGFLILAILSFLKFSFIIAGLLLILSFHLIILLTKKEINYLSLRRIYRHEGLAFGTILLLYLLKYHLNNSFPK